MYTNQKETKLNKDLLQEGREFLPKMWFKANNFKDKSLMGKISLKEISQKLRIPVVKTSQA